MKINPYLPFFAISGIFISIIVIVSWLNLSSYYDSVDFIERREGNFNTEIENLELKEHINTLEHQLDSLEHQLDSLRYELLIIKIICE